MFIIKKISLTYCHLDLRNCIQIYIAMSKARLAQFSVFNVFDVIHKEVDIKILVLNQMNEQCNAVMEISETDILVIIFGNLEDLLGNINILLVFGMENNRQ